MVSGMHWYMHPYLEGWYQCSEVGSLNLDFHTHTHTHGAHGFWKRGRTTIFDIRVTDTDCRSYGNMDSRKVLERHAREKKGKYEEACLERRRDFTPMVYSVDGMAAKEARAAERRIAGLLSAKWQRQYSEMANFVRTRMSLSVVRSNTLLLRGDRSTSWRRRGAENGVEASAARPIPEY